MISEKQKMILDFAVRNNNQISKIQAVQVIGNCYFINGSKHTGEVLSRMVKSQLLKRVKNGLYEVQKHQTVKGIINPNQLDLL
jgi:predicted transcriptional regulator of viral defense system